MKTSELIGPALDWAVAKCEGITTFGPPQGRSEAAEFLIMHSDDPDLQHSTDWAQGGPIIEREGISICTGYRWEATKEIDNQGNTECCIEYGDTILIASMRCYVASKLGDDVKIPKELK